MYLEAINEYHAQIEYIGKVLEYINFAKEHDETDPLQFLTDMLESDRRVYEKTVNTFLDAMEKRYRP